MSRPPGQQLLMPVQPVFVWASLVLALLWNLVPLGRNPWMPDVLALALVFWTVHQPRRVGLGVAFVFGILMDVHDGALLGQHALAYTLLNYFALAIQRRLLWFSTVAQALQVAPLFFSAHVVVLCVRLASGGMFPGWTLVLAPLGESLLWPLAAQVLLAPQRRAPDPDQNRPI